MGDSTMSGKNNAFLLMFLLLLPTVFAGDFEISTQNIEIPICSCASAVDSIIITNKEAGSRAYLLESDSEWSSFYPNNFVLGSGKSITVKNTISPPCGMEGDYDVRTTVTSSSGVQKFFSQRVMLDKCQNIAVDINDYSLSNCACSPTLYSFLISNLGTYTETYDFYAEGYEEYVELEPGAVSLKPGASTYVDVMFTPPCDVKKTVNLTFNAFARTSKLLAKTPIFLTVKSCFDYSLDVDETFELCEGVEEKEDLKIKNLGDFLNTYSASLQGPDWISLEYEGMVLNPLQNGLYEITMNPPEGSEGIYDVVFDVVSEEGEVNENTTFEIRVDNCYDFYVDILEDEDTICCGDHDYEVQVKSRGSKDTELKFETDQSWAGLSENEMEIEPGKRDNLEINISPVCRDKSYELKVKAYVSDYEDIFSEDVITLNVLSSETCYNIESIKPKVKVFYKNQSIPLKFKNTGLDTTTYDLSLLDAPSWVSLNETSVEIPTGKSWDIYLNLKPTSDLLEDIYNVEILFEVPGEDISYMHSVELELKHENDLKVKAKQFFVLHYIKILIVIGALIVLGVLYKVFEKVKENKLKKRISGKAPKKEKRKRKGLKKSWKIFFTLVVLLIVLCGGFLIYYSTMYKPNLGTNTTFNEDMFVIMGDIMGYLAPVNITEEEEEELFVESFVYQVLEQGKTKKIDLSNHIIDPDGDTLIYTATKPKTVLVEFKGNNVYLTPYELGKTSIMFKGDDMQGGVISVNATLVVKEPEVPYAESYFDYILIGVVLLIIVLGVLRLTEDKNNNNSKKKK